MKRKFKSKIDWAILTPIAILLLTIETLMVLNRIWVGGVIAGLVILFIAYLYIDTVYIFTGDNKLKIKSGFLINKQIEINSITKVTKTNNPLASPALSLDRSEIFYNKEDSVIVSPKRKIEFLAHLKNVNPNINFEI